MEETVEFQSLRMRSFRNGQSILVQSGVISRNWNIRVLHVKVAAPPCRSPIGEAGLRLLEASRLSFDRPLPGRSPTRPSLPYFLNPFFIIATQSPWGESLADTGRNSREGVTCQSMNTDVKIAERSLNSS